MLPVTLGNGARLMIEKWSVLKIVIECPLGATGYIRQ